MKKFSKRFLLLLLPLAFLLGCEMQTGGSPSANEGLFIGGEERVIHQQDLFSKAYYLESESLIQAEGGAALQIPPINIAFNQPVQVSSEYGTYIASNLNDGNLESAWGTLAGSKSQWCYVDLGENKEIEHIILEWLDQYSATEFSFGLSQDGVNWDLKNVSNWPAGKSITYSPNTTIPYRYVGVLLKSANHVGYAISELQIISPVEESAFVTKWNVLGPSVPFEIPLASDGTYDFTIDWGDGIKEHYTSIPVVHHYDNPGKYYVTIEGICEGFGYQESDFTPVPPLNDLLDILQWGDVKLHNGGYQFYRTDKLNHISALDTPNLSNITNASSMFKHSEITSGLSNWNTSQIVDMSNMFYGADRYNEDLSNWNTSKTQNMRGMFLSADRFNGDVTGWNTSRVIDMGDMFKDTLAFDKDVSNWDLSNIRSMREMFAFANAFTNGGNPTGLNAWGSKLLPSANTSYMFTGCPMTPLPDWYTP